MIDAICICNYMYVYIYTHTSCTYRITQIVLSMYILVYIWCHSTYSYIFCRDISYLRTNPIIWRFIPGRGVGWDIPTQSPALLWSDTDAQWSICPRAINIRSGGRERVRSYNQSFPTTWFSTTMCEALTVRKITVIDCGCLRVDLKTAAPEHLPPTKITQSYR